MMILPRFEADDLELQDEHVQVRIMDYDACSANDAMIWYDATCDAKVWRSCLFEADDLELQDEQVQVRIMDYEAYSTNDTMIW